MRICGAGFSVVQASRIPILPNALPPANRCGLEIEALAALESEALGLIGRLKESKHREALTWRYLNGWEREKICQALGTPETPMNRTWVWRLHRRALAEFLKVTTQSNITL